MKSQNEADDLFAAAYGKFEKAVQIRPDDYEAMHWWGNALAQQGKMKRGPETGKLLAQACEKYERAVQIKPDAPEILKSWGSALLEQSKAKSGADAERFLSSAGEKLTLAEGLHRGTGAYDLARIEALSGNPDGSRRWLTVAGNAGALPSRAHLLEDDDLASVRELDWFANFVGSSPVSLDGGNG
jgi:tetratricopeptide (TPR) repeat protein